MAELELAGVTKRYGAVTAIEDISLRVSSGELITLLGPSGCGKTTTLNVVAGFIEPDTGAVTIDGRAMTGVPLHKRNTSMMFQGYALFPHMTVAQNVAFGLEMRQTTRSEITRRVGEALDLTQLGSMADRFPKQLSGGQQQRVALARALVVEPSVLLLDEPLSSLDPKLRGEMRGDIRRIQKAVGITTVHVSHDQQEALAMSDRIVVMNGGKIEQVGTPSEIYQQPRTRFVADFIGNANVLEVRIVERSAATVTIEALGTRFLSTGPCSDQIGSTATFMIRPEHVAVERSPASGANAFEARIRARSFLGAITVFELETAGVGIVAHVSGREAEGIGEGDRIAVRFPPEALLAIGNVA